jgi:hypothetical protein
MKSLGRFPNLLMNVSTLGFVWIDLAIVLIVQATMPDIEVILFVIFIGVMIYLVLTE